MSLRFAMRAIRLKLFPIKAEVLPWHALSQ